MLAMTTAIGALPANALSIQVGQVIAQGWWNVNHAPTGGCGGTSADGSNGAAGHRAVNTQSKFEVLVKVAAKQVHIHINTDATYDVGAAEAAYLWPRFFGTQINCSQVAAFVGQDQFHVFRTLACGGYGKINSAWASNLAGFCNLPDSQLFGNGPSPLFSTMNSAYRLVSVPGGTSSCLSPDGARSEERFYWPGLNTYVGKQKSPIGTLKVTIDAITVDAGVKQQRMIDPTDVVMMMSTWNTLAYTFVGTFGSNWSYTTTGNNGQTILDLNKYATQVTGTIIGGIQLNIGGQSQLAWQYLTKATATGCALNPDAKTAFDPSDNAVAESVDGAMRNLFDNLAGKPYTTDVLCTAKQPPLCANLFRLTQTIWNSGPDHGTALIKGFIGQLLK
jgi:hypothetical protein